MGFHMWKAFFGAKFHYCHFLFSPSSFHKINDPLANRIGWDSWRGKNFDGDTWEAQIFYMEEALRKAQKGLTFTRY